MTRSRPMLPRVGGLVDGRDPAVERDHERGAAGDGLVEAVRAEAVAVLEPVGDEEATPRRPMLARNVTHHAPWRSSRPRRSRRRRGRARCPGWRWTMRSAARVHVAHQERVVEPRDRRTEERPRALERVHAAKHERARERHREVVELRRDRLDVGLVVYGAEGPAVFALGDVRGALAGGRGRRGRCGRYVGQSAV